MVTHLLLDKILLHWFDQGTRERGGVVSLSTLGQPSIVVYACDVQPLKSESALLLGYDKTESKKTWAKLPDEQKLLHLNQLQDIA